MTLPVLIDSELFPPDVWEGLQSLAPELSHAYTHRQIFRTETEARVSVLDDLHHPTLAAKYWQSIREQTVMLEQLAVASFEYRRNEVAIKRCERRLQELLDPLDAEEVHIDLDQALFTRASLRTVALDRVRELHMWSKLKAELDNGSFDVDNVDAHQLVSYTRQFALRAAIADPTKMTGGELDNLTGLLQTSIRRCKDLGVYDQMISGLPEHVALQFKGQA